MARTEGLEFHVFEKDPNLFEEKQRVASEPSPYDEPTGEPHRAGAASAGPATNVWDSPGNLSPSESTTPSADSITTLGDPVYIFESQNLEASQPPEADVRATPSFSGLRVDDDESQGEPEENVFEPAAKPPLNKFREELPLPEPSAVRNEVSPSTEIALLLDHLSLAKEENREILRLTQDSIAKISQMAETMMAMKDSILSQKDEELARLKLQVAERESAVNRLRQEVEDMSILLRTIDSGGQ